MSSWYVFPTKAKRIYKKFQKGFQNEEGKKDGHDTKLESILFHSVAINFVNFLMGLQLKAINTGASIQLEHSCQQNTEWNSRERMGVQKGLEPTTSKTEGQSHAATLVGVQAFNNSRRKFNSHVVCSTVLWGQERLYGFRDLALWNRKGGFRAFAARAGCCGSSRKYL